MYVYIYIHTLVKLYSCIHIVHHLILLHLNPFDLSVDRGDDGLSTLCHSSQVLLSTEGAKNVSWSKDLCSCGRSSMTSP